MKTDTFPDEIRLSYNHERTRLIQNLTYADIEPYGERYIHHLEYERVLADCELLQRQVAAMRNAIGENQPHPVGIQRDAKKLEKGFPEVVDLWLGVSGALYHARSSDYRSHSRRYFRADRSVHRDIHERILQENAKAVAAVVKECQAEIDKLKDAIANLESELVYQGKR